MTAEDIVHGVADIGSGTYLLRQMIRADVEGCEAFVSFCLEEDDEVCAEETGLCPWEEVSDASPPAALLLFFFAMFSCSEDLDQCDSCTHRVLKTVAINFVSGYCNTCDTSDLRFCTK